MSVQARLRSPGITTEDKGIRGDADKKQTQMKKDYITQYFTTITPMLLKAPEVEIFDRMGDEWVSVRKEVYPGRE